MNHQNTNILNNIINYNLSQSFLDHFEIYISINMSEIKKIEIYQNIETLKTLSQLNKQWNSVIKNKLQVYYNFIIPIQNVETKITIYDIIRQKYQQQNYNYYFYHYIKNEKVSLQPNSTVDLIIFYIYSFGTNEMLKLYIKYCETIPGIKKNNLSVETTARIKDLLDKTSKNYWLKPILNNFINNSMYYLKKLYMINSTYAFSLYFSSEEILKLEKKSEEERNKVDKRIKFIILPKKY